MGDHSAQPGLRFLRTLQSLPRKPCVSMPDISVRLPVSLRCFLVRYLFTVIQVESLRPPLEREVKNDYPGGNRNHQQHKISQAFFHSFRLPMDAAQWSDLVVRKVLFNHLDRKSTRLNSSH